MKNKSLLIIAFILAVICVLTACYSLAINDKGKELKRITVENNRLSDEVGHLSDEVERLNMLNQDLSTQLNKYIQNND